MDDDEFRIIKEDIVLIEQQETEDGCIVHRFREKRVTLVSEEGCIILYYSDPKNKSFETAQFVSLSGCKLLIGEGLLFEILISGSFSIRFQASGSEDKRRWIEVLEVHLVKVPVPAVTANHSAVHPAISKLTLKGLGGGTSLPEIRNENQTNGPRNFNMSAPAQVESGESDDEEEDEVLQRPVNNTNVTPLVTPRVRREPTEEEQSIINLFPQFEVEIILDALEFCGGDRDEVVSLLSTQPRLSFQDLNSCSPLGKSARGAGVRGASFMPSSSYLVHKENIERELEELEKELKEYTSDDEDSMDSDLEREYGGGSSNYNSSNGTHDHTQNRLSSNHSDGSQMNQFIAKYCSTSYTSSSSYSSLNSNNYSPTQFQKLRVKSHRLKQIEEYYSNQEERFDRVPDDSKQQVQTPPVPRVPDIMIQQDEQDLEIEFNNNVNINNNLNHNNKNQQEKEDNRVQLVIRKKSSASPNSYGQTIQTSNSLQWSYKPPSSLSNLLSEPIGLRTSQEKQHGTNNSLQQHPVILISPPSSPQITPPISPALLSSPRKITISAGSGKQNSTTQKNANQTWKPSLKSGIAWDLSISVKGFLKLNDHIEYRIHVISRHSEWIVYRRYNNFFLLHKKLRDMGIFKESNVKLPPKKLRGTSYQVAKSRQLDLQSYLNTLLSTFKGIFYNNSCVNVFLNSDVSSDVFQQFMIQQFDQQLQQQLSQSPNLHNIKNNNDDQQQQQLQQ